MLHATAINQSTSANRQESVQPQRNGNAVKNRSRPGEGAERSWGSPASAFIIAFCFGLGASFPSALCQCKLTDNSTILLFGCSDHC